MMDEEKFQSIVEALEYWQKERIKECTIPKRPRQSNAVNSFDSGYMLGIQHTIAHVRCRITLNEVKS